jgi:integrase
LERGWSEIPKWVFCSETGTAFEERNCERAWYRVRRRAQKTGVRPLKLHCTRHTWASFALPSGKSVRWVADELGHASPMLTLKTYAHAIREEEADLSFADFEVREGSERL